MSKLNLIDIPVWLVTLVLSLAAVYIYFRWKHGLWRRLGVPGPDPTPFFGILRSMQTRGRIQTDTELVKRYGKIIGIYHGYQPCLLVSDPDIVKKVMVKEFASFPNRYLTTEPLRELKPSLLFAENEHWRFVRSTLTPTFTSGKMRDMNPLIQKCCVQLLENIERNSDGGKTVDMKAIFEGYTMDVIATTAFGLEVDSQKNPNNEFVKSAKAFFTTSVTSPFQMFMFMFPMVGKLAARYNIRPQSVSKRLRFLVRVVAATIGMRKKEGNVRKDFLDLMMNAHKDTMNGTNVGLPNGDLSSEKNRGLTLDEITANSVLFFIAGYDTTANTLAFMSYNIAVHPECQDRVVQEIDDEIGMDMPNYENLHRLKYLDMVMSESLRLYGPVMRLNRKIEKKTVISGYKIPANTEIAFSVYNIHRDPANWPDPEKFDPERFTPENKEKRHSYSYMPFGEGPRKCIGMRLAQMEAKAAIVYILQRYRLLKCDETEFPVKPDDTKLVLTTRDGVKLKLEPRK